MAEHISNPDPDCQHAVRIRYGGPVEHTNAIYRDALSDAHLGKFTVRHRRSNETRYLDFMFSDANTALAFKIRWA